MNNSFRLEVRCNLRAKPDSRQESSARRRFRGTPSPLSGKRKYALYSGQPEKLAGRNGFAWPRLVTCTLPWTILCEHHVSKMQMHGANNDDPISQRDPVFAFPIMHAKIVGRHRDRAQKSFGSNYRDFRRARSNAWARWGGAGIEERDEHNSEEKPQSQLQAKNGARSFRLFKSSRSHFMF